MKNVYYLFSILLFVSITSCEKLEGEKAIVEIKVMLNGKAANGAKAYFYKEQDESASTSSNKLAYDEKVAFTISGKTPSAYNETASTTGDVITVKLKTNTHYDFWVASEGKTSSLQGINIREIEDGPYEMTVSCD